MTDDLLSGRRILIVEDEYLIADDLRSTLAAMGVEVLGPIASLDEALAYVASGKGIDLALLDVNLRGDMTFPVADALQERAIPFVFATGYDQCSLPDRFSATLRLEKPLQKDRLARAIRPLLHPA